MNRNWKYERYREKQWTQDDCEQKIISNDYLIDLMNKKVQSHNTSQTDTHRDESE